MAWLEWLTRGNSGLGVSLSTFQESQGVLSPCLNLRTCLASVLILELHEYWLSSLINYISKQCMGDQWRNLQCVLSKHKLNYHPNAPLTLRRQFWLADAVVVVTNVAVLFNSRLCSRKTGSFWYNPFGACVTLDPSKRSHLCQMCVKLVILISPI